jgi:hypothetical protein
MSDKRDDDGRSIIAAGGWTASIEIGTAWDAALEEQEDGTFVPVREEIPVVSTRRGGLRFGQPPPPGYVPPEPPVVHRVFLSAYGDHMNPGAGMLQLECSCGAHLWDQDDEPGSVSLDDLAYLARRHEDPDEDEEW